MHTARWRALERAETLVAENKSRPVRVTSENNEGRIQRETIFENKGRIDAPKQITISRVNEAPLCSEINDYYTYESRKVIGRILRAFLDDRKITALELLFNREHIQAFEGNERLLYPAVQRIATLQSKKSGVKQVDIADKLYGVITQIKDRSNRVIDSDEEFRVLKESGLRALFSHLDSDYEPEQKYLHARATLAVYLKEHVTLDHKLDLMIEFLEEDQSDEAFGLIDEIIAEILYSSEILMGLLNHEPDVEKECLSLIQLGKGTIVLPKKPHVAMRPISMAMAKFRLPLTKSLLIQRVQAHVRSVKSLAGGNDDGNRQALVRIIRELRDKSGLLGGPSMCEAVTMRAKITLRYRVDDLTLSESVESVLGLLPTPAARLGYLLDVSQSSLMSKNRLLVEEELQKVEEKLSSISSLLPGMGDPREALTILTELMKRLKQGEFPKQVHTNLCTKIEKYKRICEAAIATGKSGARKKSDGKDKDMTKGSITMDRKTVPAGACIFSEGDEAKCAYLLKTGNVEISTMKDDNKVILTTLGRSQIFGELALLDGSARSATATALSDCELIVVTAETLETQIEKLDDFVKCWLLFLGGRIRDLTERIENQ